MTARLLPALVAGTATRGAFAALSICSPTHSCTLALLRGPHILRSGSRGLSALDGATRTRRFHTDIAAST